MTKVKTALFLAAVVILGGQEIFSQTDSLPKNSPTPVFRPTPPSAENFNNQIDLPRERREQAYAKLLEGQRYLNNIKPSRTANAGNNNAALAKQAFQKAIELNPNLSEAYTGLAELAISTAPVNIEEALSFAATAVKIRPDNFNARQIMARIYTLESSLNSPAKLDPRISQKAINEWKELTKIDPQYAEAWAFLSEFYARTDKLDDQINALKKWRVSATPIDTRFYRTVLGAQENLSPDRASLKLGAALIKAGRAAEAVEVLSQTLSDDPENMEAIDLLKQAVEINNGKISAATLQALQQAVYANPNNTALIELNAGVQSRSGNTDGAAKSLRSSIASLEKTDKASASQLQITLGDIFVEANQIDEAATEYEKSLQMREIGNDEINLEEDREFAAQVFSKIIQAYKNAGKITEAKSAIERARTLLGKEDLFADKQSITLLRETGRKQEALQAVRNLRLKMKDDYSLMRLEATLLTDLGRVDEGVKLIRTLLTKPAAAKSQTAVKNGQNQKDAWVPTPSPYYDDFTNYIFISSLYNQAKRGGDAVEAARQASIVAESEEKKQMAELSLATAQQTAGNFQSAEQILRNLLKKTPGNPVALNNLGYFLLERNEKIDEAIALIKQAVNIDPTNASYLDSLGWAFFKQGKLGEAEMYLKEAVRNDSASATVYEHLGDVYHKQGKFDLAKSAWQKAINISNDSEAENRLKDKLADRLVK